MQLMTGDYQICILLDENRPLQKLVSVWPLFVGQSTNLCNEEMDYQILSKLMGVGENMAKKAFLQAISTGIIGFDGTVDENCVTYVKGLITASMFTGKKGRPKDG